MTPAAPRPLHSAHASRARWLPILILSALLHLLFISEVGGILSLPMPGSPPRQEQVVAASLVAPPLPKPKLAPKPKPPAKPRRVVPARPALPPPPTDNAEPAVMMDTPQPTPIEEHPAIARNADGTATDMDADAVDTVAEAPAAAPDAPTYHVSLPPPARLKFAIEKKPHDGEPMHGSGTIDWQTDGARYAIDGEFGVLFITALRFRSSGTIEENGIAPELYAEKRLRRSATNTHFHRERNTISFSASANSYPRLGSEQDRASIIWQLAGIGRGDAEHFQAGTTIRVVVAGTRDAEPWEIGIVGLEQINADGEQVEAWHLLRAPRPGSYDQKLEFWLAPALGWYPVRLRYTEPNGDVLDMSLTRLNVSTPPESQQ